MGHVVRNLTQNEERVEENSLRHVLLGSSSDTGKDYIVGDEVGCACALPMPAEEQANSKQSPGSASALSAKPKVTTGEKSATEAGADCVFIVPSLETREMEGAYMLHLVCTDPIEVEQVH